MSSATHRHRHSGRHGRRERGPKTKRRKSVWQKGAGRADRGPHSKVEEAEPIPVFPLTLSSVLNISPFLPLLSHPFFLPPSLLYHFPLAARLSFLCSLVRDFFGSRVRVHGFRLRGTDVGVGSSRPSRRRLALCHTPSSQPPPQLQDLLASHVPNLDPFLCSALPHIAHPTSSLLASVRPSLLDEPGSV